MKLVWIAIVRKNETRITPPDATASSEELARRPTPASTLADTRIAAIDALANYQNAHARLERLTPPRFKRGTSK